MLRRAALPLLGPGRCIRPVCPHAGQIQIRHFAKGDRPKGREHKPPSSTKPASQQNQPFRKASWPQSTSSSKVNSSEPPISSSSPDTTHQSAPHPNTHAFGEDPTRDLDDVSESVARASKQSLRDAEEQLEEASNAQEAPQPQQPLPDLTKGIPSTLDAELREAQSRQAPAHSSSLNITEDPAEELPSGARGRGGDDIPREEYISSSDRKKNAVFRYMYIVLGLGAVGGSVYMGRNWENEEEEKKHSDAPSGWGIMHFYNRITARLGDTMSYYRDPVTTKLLPDEDPDPNFRFPFVLVISLEDMLVHSEWTREKGWRIAKRPGVDYFLRYLSAYYEIVLFTSQPSAVVDQVIRKLDPYSMIRWPLFREATLYKDGGYVKVSLDSYEASFPGADTSRTSLTSIEISKRLS
jgi:mitochondrial import inner membrane translocase subunit TIM50